MVKNIHPVRTHPATSYVATTFHPTIGHRAHQSLSNICHPQARHDSLRNKGLSRLTHSQGTQISQAWGWQCC